MWNVFSSKLLSYYQYLKPQTLPTHWVWEWAHVKGYSILGVAGKLLIDGKDMGSILKEFTGRIKNAYKAYKYPCLLFYHLDSDVT